MSTSASYGLVELEKEKGFGGVGETVDRSIPQIDMSDFFSRKAEITEEGWKLSVPMSTGHCSRTSFSRRTEI